MYAMRLVVALKLLPSPQQAALLHDTLRQANAAANVISARAWRERTFNRFALHKLVYAQMRQEFFLSSQIVVRLIAKVADGYRVDRGRQRRFRPLGGIAYDDRVLRFGSDHVSIWTIAGRQSIAFVCAARQ